MKKPITIILIVLVTLAAVGVTLAPANTSILVAFDIRPTSCPNPMAFAMKGVVPAAILGTDELDVTTIDPATLRLVLASNNSNGVVAVAPLRWSYKDVATPYLNGEECGCTTEEEDGYQDLNLKFKAQEILEILLDGYNVGEVVPLKIEGYLKAEFGGTFIAGQDCVVIMR